MAVDERRRVCDAWVSTTLEDAIGVDTPLSTIYNEYRKLHPTNHLNITQVRYINI